MLKAIVHRFFIGALLLLADVPSAISGTAVAPDREKIADTLSRLPLAFEQNRGQSSSDVQFLSRSQGYAVYLSGGGATLLLRGGGRIDMRLAGAGSPAPATGSGLLPGVSNYLRGSDPAGWITGVPHFEKVRFPQVYRGIDLVYYGNARRLEYDFVVNPGADPRRIRLRFDSVEGIRIDSNGDLVLRNRGEDIRQHRPVVYQDTPEGRRRIGGSYVLRGREVSFQVGRYDRSKPLVIDPVVAYATYFGGGGYEWVKAVATDSGGNVYLAGGTNSTDLPLQGPYDGTPSWTDAFITKINPAGTAIVYSTYLGGASNADDGATGIKVDASGQAVVTGYTKSADFPIKSALQNAPGGDQDGFVAKLSAAGNALVWSTYLGGSGLDAPAGVALAPTGDIYVAGWTLSPNLATAGALQTALNGAKDGFVAKFNAAGTEKSWVTYVGGSKSEELYGIAADATGVYVVGKTNSGDFPLLGAFSTGFNTFADMYLGCITKLSPAGARVYASYVGNNSLGDMTTAVDVDSAGAAYITGSTSANPFYGATHNVLGGYQPYALKVAPSGASVAWASLLASRSSFKYAGLGIALDPVGNVWIAGETDSVTFPVVDPFQSTRGQDSFPTPDAFIARLSSAGTVQFATYYGASGADSAVAIASDPSGNIYVAGTTESASFPTLNALQAGFAGQYEDAFLIKLLNCDLAGTLSSATFASAGGSGSIVITAPGCPWVVGASAPWITVTSARSGSGSTTVTFDVAPNRQPERTAYVSVAGKQFVITQSAPSTCMATLEPATLTVWDLVTVANIKLISSLPSCTWNVSSSQPWLTVNPTTLTGSGNITYSISNNTDGPERTANIIVSDQVTTVTQRAWGTTPCTYFVGLTSASTGAAGGSGSTSVNTNAPYCAWTAVSSDPTWLTATPASGKGSASITWSTGINTGPERSGTITIAGKVIPVTQTAAGTGCTYTVNPNTITAPVGETTGTIIVTASGQMSNCTWLPAPSQPWIAVSNTPRQGNGSFTYTIAQNTGGPRTATISIAGLTVNISQAGVPVTCSISLNGSGATVASAGGTGNIGVVANDASCPWTATSSQSWLTLSPAGGSGNGSVGFTAAPNTGPQRTATVTIAGQSYTITQDASPGYCALTLTPNSAAADYRGGTWTFNLATAPAGCAWTASSNASWAQVGLLSGNGATAVEYTVFPNFSTKTRTAVFTVGGQSFTITQTASTMNADQRFVGQMYFNYFGRVPTQAEIDFQVTNGLQGSTRQDLALGFYNSLEFNNAGRFVAGLYVGILDRDAEYGGWLFQRTAYARNIVNQDQLVGNFINSQEFQLKNGSLANPDFVRLLYRQILLREASQAEVDFQVANMTGTNPRVVLARNFLNSNEFRIGTGPRLTAFLLYATVLLRDGTSAERAATRALIQAGTPLRNIIETMMSSAEFAALLN